MKKLFTMAFAVLAVAAFIGFSATSSDAVHKGSGTLSCGGCHTMHNSQGGGANTLGGGPTAVLLRGTVAGGLHVFCLNCHADNGGNAGATVGPGGITPPKVYLDASSSVSAGGNFYPALDNAYAAGANDDNANFALGYGHSVGDTLTTAPVPPGGAAMATALTCTSCHDPHGAPTGAWATNGINLFRNLRTVPTGSGGAGVTLTGVMGAYGSSSDGVTGAAQAWAAANSGAASHVWPVADATRNNIYGTAAADGAGGGISGWCSQCHDDWHEANVAGNASGNDWTRHPVDNRLVDGSTGSGNGNLIVDWANYVTNTLPSADTAGTADDTLLASGSWYADNQSDKVFCLSCHYAHGGPNYDNLRWAYLSGVSAGGQTPNGVATGTGCNVCHNK